ncbi:YeeE/YedE family protein [Shewanella canadensis]|uniref:YeeE/YedE family protein n=1 Tax=Shewanella canadensis TaxID=271096 RepID=A0A431WX76_9GAMM|nr:YeeE/YedE thiosulfate transporter family protein [Shewanella canadensis]RTR40040.1 YeeE/YedE family protein [Shewanella canadensis]
MDLSSFAAAFGGGILIGLSAILLMIFNGRIAGISGIVSSAIFSDRKLTDKKFTDKKSSDNTDDETGPSWQWFFITGLVLTGVIYALVYEQLGLPVFEFDSVSRPMLLIGGLLVGLGCSLGRGCTSGHGICGIGRLSLRSIVATCLFIAVAACTAVFTH